MLQLDRDELVDAVLGASRALVAVAARSLATLADDVTLAQYRVLVELAARGLSAWPIWLRRSPWIARRRRGCAIGWCASIWCTAGGSAMIAGACVSR